MNSESAWARRDAAELPNYDEEYEAMLRDAELESLGPDEWPCDKCGTMKPGCECDIDECMRALDAASSVPASQTDSEETR